MKARHKILSPILIACLCFGAALGQAQEAGSEQDIKVSASAAPSAPALEKKKRQKREKKKAVYPESVPRPTLSNIPYGSHKRQVLDFWKTPSASGNKPVPRVFYIHSGAWLQGKLVSATLFSRDGTDCSLRYGGKVHELKLKPGQDLAFTPQ